MKDQEYKIKPKKVERAGTILERIASAEQEEDMINARRLSQGNEEEEIEVIEEIEEEIIEEVVEEEIVEEVYEEIVEEIIEEEE